MLEVEWVYEIYGNNLYLWKMYIHIYIHLLKIVLFKKSNNLMLPRK